MNSVSKIIDLYIRALILVLALTIGVAFIFVGARAALAASLKTVNVISGDSLTLGDVFDGLSNEQAAYILGPAPQPGQEMILNASTLMRVAVALDLEWRPATSADQIVIRRAASIVAESDIRDTIIKTLKEKGLSGKFNMTISGAPPQMILPPDQMPSVEVLSVKFDPGSDWFEVALVAPSAQTPIIRANVMGRIQRLASVPVLKSTLRNGDVINSSDITWIEIDEKNIQHNNILKEKSMIGLTPRRMAVAGKPLRDNDLERPQLVGRGDFVTLLFRSGPMLLSAKGKALQGGAEGDIIRFVNVTSNRTLDGIISGDHEVTVSQ